MNLLIYGASGLAKEVADIAGRSYPDRWEKIYFIDYFVDEGRKTFGQTIRFSTVEEMISSTDERFEGVVAVGEPGSRELLTHRFQKLGVELVNIIDSTAVISPSARLGKGVIVCEMVLIHAFADISDGVLLQPQVVVGHDIKIGKFSVLGAHCAPGGESTFGEKVYVGMNASIKEKLVIGDDAIISMGAVVYNDVEAGNTVIGNPARVTRGNDQHRVFK